MPTKYNFFAIFASALILAAASAWAQLAPAKTEPIIATESTPQVNPPNDILPVKSAAEADFPIDEANPTHSSVKLTPDKSELIRLDRKAAVVLVGNPAHLSILPEGSNTLVLVPQAPGATYFTVLDEDNKIIMQRHVIVASPKEKYVRIRKPCAGGTDCEPTKVYYCPDMCHEIILNNGTSSGPKGASPKAETEKPAATAENAAEPAPTEVNSDGEEAAAE